jgi:hypothetical protein
MDRHQAIGSEVVWMRMCSSTLLLKARPSLIARGEATQNRMAYTAEHCEKELRCKIPHLLARS